MRQEKRTETITYIVDESYRIQYMSKAQMEKSIERTKKLMQEAAKKLDFIEAAQYRDEVLKMEELLKEKDE